MLCFIEREKPAFDEKPVKEYGDPYATLMIRGAIFYRGKSDLHIYEGSVNGNSISEFLREFLIPRAKSLYGNRWRLLQDLVPAPRSHITSSSLRIMKLRRSDGQDILLT